MKSYPETNQKGLISIDKNILNEDKIGNFGIQIAKDGRIWICIDGISAIRFRPLSEQMINQLKKGD